MKRIKENAYTDFCNMVCHSWTFVRMTEQEKKNCKSALHFAVEQDVLKGNYEARYMILNAVYDAFLCGIGFDGPMWREPEPENVPF